MKDTALSITQSYEQFAGHSCQLDVMLAYELFDDANAAALLYPLNVLRNYATLQVGLAGECRGGDLGCGSEW